MDQRNRRLIAGLLVGVVAGVLGPVLTAVANHSGTQSGNEPLDLGLTSEHDVTATAAWSVAGRDFTIEVRRDSGAAASANATEQSAARTDSGTILATGYACVGPWFDKDCREHTWRGTLTSAYSDGNWLANDPSLGYARLQAWMRPDGHAEGCAFSVEWFGEETPGHTTDDSLETPEHVVAAGASLGLERGARASVLARCWDANADNEWDAGDGTLTSATSIDARIEEHAEDAHPPFCRELDLCD